MNVTLRQLRAFCALAHTSSFTEAAGSLHVTQSALSGLIKELEQILGVQVVHRSTRKVQLSEAGREFYPLARNFSLTYGNARAIAALRMRVGSGAMALVKDTRSSKYSQNGIPSLRQVFFRLAKVSRH